MKRLLFVVLASSLMLGWSLNAYSQSEGTEEGVAQTEEATDSLSEGDSAALPAESMTPAEEELEENPMLANVNEDVPLHQQLKTKFIEGGPMFMGVILLLLILGLAIVIERIIYLNLSSTNTEKLLKKIESALSEGGIDQAKDICRNSRGPVASIFYQGLCRTDEGLESVEKAVVSYGSVQMQQLESGLTWISLFIALAPMFGFMGTVLGMISAFDAIEIAGDIAPSLVAGGIKIALITTVFGLIVAAILQIFYNYILAKIDSIVMSMEDASISFVDILVHQNLSR